jgi:uncharacterized protein HemX
MANPLRDMSVFMQALVAVAIAVVLMVAGVYTPGSPIAREREELAAAVDQRTKLTQEVTQLQVYKQRYAELKQQMDALNKQLDTLKTIVPEEKEADEFIRRWPLCRRNTTTRCRLNYRRTAHTSTFWTSSAGWDAFPESLT